MLKDAIDRMRVIAQLLDDDDPDKQEMLNTEADYAGLMEWALAKQNESLIISVGLKTLIDSYTERKKRYDARAGRFKEICGLILESAGESKYEGVYATVYTSKKQQGVQVIDESKIPDAYFETVKTLDKVALKKTLKSGKPVVGATLDNGGLTLNIKRK